MDIDAPTITVAQLADGAADLPALGVAGKPLDPVLIVELDGADVAVAAEAATRVTARDRLLIGRCSGALEPDLSVLTGALDVTYAVGADRRNRAVVAVEDVDVAVAAFVAEVSRCPQAALIAGQVVRISPLLPAPEAIDLESFAYSTLQGGGEFRRWLDERRRLGRSLPPPPTGDPVLVARHGDVLHITLNRPERRNAYGTAVRDALAEALRLAVADPSLTVVLDGAGSSFCAGGDLDEFGHAPDAATAHLIRTRGGAGRLVAELADRVEVRLHGHCVGAGIEIPAFAGRVVAAPDTVIRFPEVAMGLIPGAGGAVSVPRRIGRWRALHLFVTGAAVDARRALEWGLVDEIACGETLTPTAGSADRSPDTATGD